jgi:hypothetical protein
MRGIGKAATNESKHPYVVKLEVVSDGLDIELSRQIVKFHKVRHIQPQYGRTIFRRSGPDYHWCFDDLSIAHAFIKQFGRRALQSRYLKFRSIGEFAGIR